MIEVAWIVYRSIDWMGTQLWKYWPSLNVKMDFNRMISFVHWTYLLFVSFFGRVWEKQLVNQRYNILNASDKWTYLCALCLFFSLFLHCHFYFSYTHALLFSVYPLANFNGHFFLFIPFTIRRNKCKNSTNAQTILM